MKGTIKFSVREESPLFSFLLAHIKGKSRNNIKSILKRGQITVDGDICRDYAHLLRPGQQVELAATAPEPDKQCPLPILYEDEELLVVDKPAGMLSVSTDKEHENTAYHAITDYEKSKNPSARVFIVHRLDRDTSGIMLLAKNERIKLAFQENWDELVLLREYTAVVEGKVNPPEGTITSWLKQTKTLLVYSSKTDGQGKKAITHYKTREASDDFSILDVSLETGRKNQIRVHMKDMGNPVAGDKKYGARTNPLGRLGLHASKLTVTHPFTREEKSFISPMPRVFRKVL